MAELIYLKDQETNITNQLAKAYDYKEKLKLQSRFKEIPQELANINYGSIDLVDDLFIEIRFKQINYVVIDALKKHELIYVPPSGIRVIIQPGGPYFDNENIHPPFGSFNPLIHEYPFKLPCLQNATKYFLERMGYAKNNIKENNKEKDIIYLSFPSSSFYIQICFNEKLRYLTLSTPPLASLDSPKSTLLLQHNSTFLNGCFCPTPDGKSIFFKNIVQVARIRLREDMLKMGIDAVTSAIKLISHDDPIFQSNKTQFDQKIPQQQLDFRSIGLSKNTSQNQPVGRLCETEGERR